MESFVHQFIRSSLLWLATGVCMGIWLALEPGAAIYRPAHMHANLLGFVGMMIFGVAYHVLPRFAGTPLRSRKTARLHLVLANAGLVLMVLGWVLRANAVGSAPIVLAGGAILSALGAFLFIGNIWLTLDAGTRLVPPTTTRPLTLQEQRRF